MLLVLTLLITPAGAAQRLTAHPGLVILYSIVIAVVATVGGIACGVVTSLPVSFFVSSISLAVYLAARLVGSRAPASRRAA